MSKGDKLYVNDLDSNGSDLTDSTITASPTVAPQSAEQAQLVRAISLGFAVVLGLTVVLGGIGLQQLNSVNASMDKIVTVNNSKIALASAMRDAIRLRAVSINKMLSLRDYFKRDQELMKFYNYARDYREARERLVDLGMDAHERAIIEKLRLSTQSAQPSVRQAAELLLESELPGDYERIFSQATAKQEALLELLDESIELQKEYANRALVAARHKFKYTVASFLLVLSVLLIIGIVIARFVVHYAANKNKALACKNLELQAARAKADEATQAKSEFLANMSHEIRTPLTIIIGFSETLVDPSINAKDRHRAVLAIQNAGKHLYDIITDVLDVSKIEAGKLEMESIAVSPLELVKETIRLVDQKAVERGLQILADFSLPLPKTIISDPIRLKQILLNLCSNAVKFTQSGTITIGLSFDSHNLEMIFTITDTGIGMTQEQADKVFAPFQQGDISIARYYGGTGLGLSISKQLARRLGGDITCESEVGKGTRFTVTVDAGAPPLQWIREVDMQEDFYAESPPRIAPAPKLCGRVLLAEDSPNIQSLVTMILNKAGLSVDAVENGAEALQQVLRERYDLIIMDLQMPVMDGLAAIQQLRQSGFDKPIVALTAITSQEDKNRCLIAGADNYIVKPLDVAVFYNILSQHLPEQHVSVNDDNAQGNHCAAEPAAQEAETTANVDDELQLMISGFVYRLPETVKEITTYYRQRKWRELALSSHRLKGAGSVFGFPELSEISTNIMDNASQSGDDETRSNGISRNDLPELIDRLNQMCLQITKKAG